MIETLDERRHFRIDDRVEFRVGKASIRGTIATLRFVSDGKGGEEQLLNVAGDDGQAYERVPGATCALVGRKPADAGMRLPPQPFDLEAVATRALIARGASLISVDQIRALAKHYLALRGALANAAQTDRSSHYRPGEARACDGAKPPLDGDRWLTPRELSDLVLKGEMPQ